jgi:hypothetical protein
MKTYCNLLAIVVLLLIFTGCHKNLLPSTTIIVKSPWEGFDSAKLTYEKIIPGTTTIDDLKKFGFDPALVPNIRIMTSTDVINVFMPNPTIRKEDLDPGIQKCIDGRDRCIAYQILPGVTNSDRIGNFWLDLFTFKRHTVNTGWQFRGLITMVDGVVTYRDPPGGQPIIHTEQVDIKPLGPLQDAGSAVITTGVPKIFGW